MVLGTLSFLLQFPCVNYKCQGPISHVMRIDDLITVKNHAHCTLQEGSAIEMTGSFKRNLLWSAAENEQTPHSFSSTDVNKTGRPLGGLDSKKSVLDIKLWWPFWEFQAKGKQIGASVGKSSPSRIFRH